MSVASEYTLRQLLYYLNGGGVWERDSISQVLAHDTSTGAEEDVYVVPAGKTAYITSIWLSVYNSTANSSISILQIENATGGMQLNWVLNTAPNSSQSLALSFPVPVKLASGWSVTVSSGGSGITASAAVTGYEV